MTVKHNKLYYEQGRNGYTMSDTINPKMKLTKDELGLDVDYSKDTFFL